MANLSVFDKQFKQIKKSFDASSRVNTKTDSTTVALDVFEDKPFSIQFRQLYLTVGLLATVAQIINALMLTTIIAYVLHSVGSFLPVWVSIVLALIVTVLVEVSKRNTTKIGAKYLLKYRYLPIFISIPFLILTSISFAGAYFGSLKLPELYVNIEQTTDSTTIELKSTVDAEIARLDAEIAQGKADLLVKDNWSLRNRTLPQLEAQRAQLINEALALGEKIANTENAATIKSEAERMQKIEELQIYVLIISLSFEFLFLACTVFAYYYLWRCYVETLPVEEETSAPVTQKPVTQKPVTVPQLELPDATLLTEPLPKPDQLPKNGIGFKYNQGGITKTVINASVPVVQQDQTVDSESSIINAPVTLKEGWKVCEQCGKAYEYTVKWQKFCSNKGEGNCKDAYHMARNGGVAFNPKRYHSKF